MKRSAPLGRGKPLARGKPLERGSGLARGSGGLSRGAPLAARSPKRRAHMADERRPLVERLIEAGVTCEIGPVLAELGIGPRCAVQIGGMHERRKSGSGGSRVNPDNLMAACNVCNGWLEDCVEPERTMVEEADLVIREGHPDWDRFSKRHDRVADV